MAPPIAPPEPQRPAPPPTATAAADHEVVARVNGRALSRSDFVAAVERHMARYRSGGHQLPPSIEQRVRQAVLRRMVEDALLFERAAELGLEVGDDEAEAALAEHKARFKSPEAFAEYLARSHRTEADVRTEVRRNLVFTRVLDSISGAIEVTDAEVRAHFEANPARFIVREQIRASRILIRAPRTAGADELRAARDLANQVHRQAVRDPSSFAELARQHSDGPQASRGGVLGWFSRGRMPPDWDRVAFQLKPGSVAPPVRTDHGYEIIATWEHRPEHVPTLAEVADTIRASLAHRRASEKRKNVLRDLEARAQIEIFVDNDQQGGTQ